MAARPSQRGIANRVPACDEIASKLSLAAAFELCAEAAGFDLDKQAGGVLSMDKARWSRIKSGLEGIKWEQLQQFMDQCGNDTPLLWMLAQRGYDLHSLRRTETETEHRLRMAEEALAREREERRISEETLRRVITGASANGG
jgi:hypothetical protein